MNTTSDTPVVADDEAPATPRMAVVDWAALDLEYASWAQLDRELDAWSALESPKAPS